MQKVKYETIVIVEINLRSWTYIIPFIFKYKKDICSDRYTILNIGLNYQFGPSADIGYSPSSLILSRTK